jgi:hypothetical protein
VALSFQRKEARSEVLQEDDRHAPSSTDIKHGNWTATSGNEFKFVGGEKASGSPLMFGVLRHGSAPFLYGADTSQYASYAVQSPRKPFVGGSTRIAAFLVAIKDAEIC